LNARVTRLAHARPPMRDHIRHLATRALRIYFSHFNSSSRPQGCSASLSCLSAILSLRTDGSRSESLTHLLQASPVVRIAKDTMAAALLNTRRSFRFVYSPAAGCLACSALSHHAVIALCTRLEPDSVGVRCENNLASGGRRLGSIRRLSSCGRTFKGSAQDTWHCIFSPR